MLKVYCDAMMLDEERCRRIIAEALPELDVRSIRYFASGWDFELWEVNEGLLFRFPLREECAATLPGEVALLHELRSLVSVCVPQPRLFAGGSSIAMPFSMYEKLPGTPLKDAQLTAEGATTVARQLGEFLTELHSFPIGRAKSLGVPMRPGLRWRGRYRILHQRVKSEVYRLLDADEAAAMESFWQDFLGRDEYFEFAPVLIHGDLDQAHVLVNPDEVAVSGVIDFGDMRVGDPALDFAGFDIELRKQIAAHYGGPLDSSTLERAEIYRKRMSPLHGILYGLEEGLPELAERGLAEVREQLGKT